MATKKPDPIVTERALKAAQDRKRRQQMGKPLKVSDAGLEQAAQVGEGDAAAAAAQWDRDVPELAGLLDAEVAS